MIRAYVDFSKTIREWDGFGISFLNSLCIKPDPVPSLFKSENNLIDENSFKKIAELIFGLDGLKISIIKTFISLSKQKQFSFHYNENDSVNKSEISFTPFDQETSTFCEMAYKASMSWGATIQLLCTFTNPPGWMTRQKITGGRDLDPSHRIDYAHIMAASIKYLLNNNLPVKYLSIHHHGEDWHKWDENGQKSNDLLYSLYWPPEQVADFIKLLRRMLDKNDLANIALTSGETCCLRFTDWGYANAITEDPSVLESLGLISSCTSTIEFDNKTIAVQSYGIDELQNKHPGLRLWITNDSYSSVDSQVLSQIRHFIYNSRTNAVFVGNLFNSATDLKESPFLFTYVNDNLSVSDSYYYLKILCRAGQSGMMICTVACNLPGVSLIAFSSNNTKNHDSFVILNACANEFLFPIEIRGSVNESFNVFRTSSFEKFINLGIVKVKEGKINFKITPFSATAFYGVI